MSNQPQIVQYIREKIQSTNFFTTDINGCKIVACFGTETYGELTKYMFKKHQASVAILVDMKAKTVLATKDQASEFKLDAFIKRFCNGRSNDENHAQGTITENFIQLTKKFQPC